MVGGHARARAILKPAPLGLVSSIAAGLAIALPHRKVIAIDGDGAFLMNLCGLPTIALQNPGNLIHLLFDNEIYEASGGTCDRFAPLRCGGARQRGAGYKHACGSRSPEEFRAEFVRAWERKSADFDRRQSGSRPTERSCRR